jgi:hypothetical protein
MATENRFVGEDFFIADTSVTRIAGWNHAAG